MKKISLKITALLLGWMSFSALAEQTVDIEIRGIKGERAIRNTDMNVKLIDKGEMDGSDRYKQLVSDAVDKGLRVRMSPRVSQVKLLEQTLKLQAKQQKMKTSRHSVKTCQNKAS
ncbi:MAG: hypothetical protein E6Z92_03075 [Haemophilus parainfluenzae]|nr:hypothetical protein [Haemophilus parainfluenzae]